MKEIILDASFIISAAKEKIDLFEDLLEYKLVIPKKAISEVERVANSKQAVNNRQAAKIAKKILEKSKDAYTVLDLGKIHTDKQIEKYAKEHGCIVATLDKELKSKFKGKLAIIRAKKIQFG